MSPSENALLRQQYVTLATALGVTPVPDSLSSRRYLELSNDLLEQLVSGGVGGGGSAARLTLSPVTTPQLAPGASHLFSVLTGYRTFALVNVSVDAPARAQGYRTVAARTTDEGRPFTTDPDPLTREPKIDVNLIAGALSQAGAGLIGLEPHGTLYGRLTNTGPGPAVLTLTLEILPLEEVTIS